MGEEEVYKVTLMAESTEVAPENGKAEASTADTSFGPYTAS